MGLELFRTPASKEWSLSYLSNDPLEDPAHEVRLYLTRLSFSSANRPLWERGCLSQLFNIPADLSGMHHSNNKQANQKLKKKAGD